ncbi:cytochrome P450 [Kitasatospora atroaurantiaca]|uniref:Cytochrome P450 n=1 Tax=Kitasatospora atroaurantiaca TaxID=285545 RepID=A0A561EP92_9ACTN|nr:cytochrome P450 [Kitasatospora atroaurantiaca]TWE17441.1 cytochrome P450 [Kitasatospora atroaurantiaca]
MASGLESIPRAPGGLPFLGHVWPMSRGPLAFVKSLRATGDLVRVDLGTLPVVFVASPELAHAVMVTHGSSFEKGRLFDRVRGFVGDGLATAPSKLHRRHRRLMQPSFHRTRIAGYCDIISDRARDLAASWEPGGTLAMEEEMARFSIGTLAATMFAAEIGTPVVDVVRRDTPTILKYILLRAVSPQFLDRLPLPSNRKFDAAAANLRQVIDDEIAATRRRDHADSPDLLSTLLAARDADTGETLTDVEVRDELVTILFAGTETVGSTMAWAFHEIARHPEVEKQLLAEIDEVVGTRPVGFEDVPRLTYTRRVLDEVLRLHGVTLLMRRTTAPVDLGGVTIPEGTEVAFSPYALLRDPVLYPEPGRFDPDRWLPERAADLPRAGFLPFGAGSRQCIGDAFARAEMTITLATVLARWQLRPVPGHTPREAIAAMPHPDRVPMTVHPRETAAPA